MNEKKRVLVVVDYQKDFVDGALGFPGADKLDKKILERIKEYYRNGEIVVFTFDTHHKNYLKTREGIQLPVPHCIKGTEGWELYGSTGGFYDFYKKEKNMIAIEKDTFGISPYSLVGNSKFNNAVDDANIVSVELCGLVTNMCVISNVVTMQARFPNAQIIVNSHLCDSFDKILHEKTLDVLEGMQVKVIR